MYAYNCSPFAFVQETRYTSNTHYLQELVKLPSVRLLRHPVTLATFPFHERPLFVRRRRRAETRREESAKITHPRARRGDDPASPDLARDDRGVSSRALFVILSRRERESGVPNLPAPQIVHDHSTVSVHAHQELFARPAVRDELAGALIRDVAQMNARGAVHREPLRVPRGICSGVRAFPSGGTHGEGPTVDSGDTVPAVHAHVAEAVQVATVIMDVTQTIPFRRRR